MKKIISIVCSLFLLASLSFAQSSDSDEDEESAPKPGFNIGGINEPGDQFIKLGLMPTFPMNFDGALLVGGAGSVGYNRFLTNWFAVGAEVDFGYHPTIGSNIFTYVPILVGATVQPAFGKFEFPVSVWIGGALENYMSKNYFPGLVVKSTAGIFFRATPTWSFGADFVFTYMPQWYSDSEYNDYGIFLSAEVAARYHF
ncbi:MAG: hypothetical protein II921_10220 [Treponema sp.]|nr:hypothetical protein [Treponema sp.]